MVGESFAHPPAIVHNSTRVGVGQGCDDCVFGLTDGNRADPRLCGWDPQPAWKLRLRQAGSDGSVGIAKEGSVLLGGNACQRLTSYGSIARFWIFRGCGSTTRTFSGSP
jgi:hypothetical protein